MISLQSWNYTFANEIKIYERPIQMVFNWEDARTTRRDVVWAMNKASEMVHETPLSYAEKKLVPCACCGACSCPDDIGVRILRSQEPNLLVDNETSLAASRAVLTT